MSSSTSSDDIDALLAHYLGLLHTYTTLRTELTRLQSSVCIYKITIPVPLSYLQS